MKLPCNLTHDPNLRKQRCYDDLKSLVICCRDEIAAESLAFMKEGDLRCAREYIAEVLWLDRRLLLQVAEWHRDREAAAVRAINHYDKKAKAE